MVLPVSSADYVSEDGNTIVLKPEPISPPPSAVVVCDGPCRRGPHIHEWTPAAVTLMESLLTGERYDTIMGGSREKWLRSTRKLRPEERGYLKTFPLGRKLGKPSS